MEKKKKILLFAVDEEKRKQIQSLCRREDIEVFPIDKKRYEETIGYLAGIPTMKPSGRNWHGSAFDREMMVFFGMDQDEMSRFLDQYRAAGITPIALKAMVTPINMVWSAEKLFKEISKEHELMTGKKGR